MQIRELNHVALAVRDLERSVQFYGEVLGLPAMERPDFGFPGAWFRLGTSQELHLIVDLDAAPVEARSNHYALLIDEPGPWETRLREHGVAFREAKQRPDGAWQIFLEDPDGHTIELCTSPTAG